jgi:hypothetical protein
VNFCVPIARRNRNGPDKSIPTLGECFDKARIFSIVCECAANLVNGEIDSVLKLDECGFSPEVPPDFLSRHDLSGSLDEQQQDPEWLRPELQ